VVKHKHLKNLQSLTLVFYPLGWRASLAAKSKDQAGATDVFLFFLKISSEVKLWVAVQIHMVIKGCIHATDE